MLNELGNPPRECGEGEDSGEDGGQADGSAAEGPGLCYRDRAGFYIYLTNGLGCKRKFARSDTQNFSGKQVAQLMDHRAGEKEECDGAYGRGSRAEQEKKKGIELLYEEARQKKEAGKLGKEQKERTHYL